MGTVTSFTAARMQAIEDQAIVGGEVVAGDLILTRNNDETINAGSVVGPQGPQGDPGEASVPSISMSFAGTLAAVTGSIRWYAPQNMTIANVIISVGTAPTGAALIVDVNKNGTTIYSTQANRPSIAAGTNVDTGPNVPDVTSVTAGDYLTIDIDQVGSTVPGANLTVQIIAS